jgi:uncharacterized protein (DUF433 family)
MLVAMVPVSRDRIAADPAVLVGMPVVRGTRLAVELVLELIAAGWSFAAILAECPGLTLEYIRACVAYAKDPSSWRTRAAGTGCRTPWSKRSRPTGRR